MVDTSDAWIVERTGIRERHILDPSLAASDLATEAGAPGLPRRRASIRRPSTASSSAPSRGDCPFPADGDLRAAEAGRAPGGCAFDLSAACAGFLYGLSIARRVHPRRAVQARAGDRRRGALAHRRLDRSHHLRAVRRRRRRGAAARRTTSGERGILSTHLFADGSLTEILLAAGGRQPRAAHAGGARGQAPLREDERARGLQARRAQHGGGARRRRSRPTASTAERRRPG